MRLACLNDAKHAFVTKYSFFHLTYIYYGLAGDKKIIDNLPRTVSSTVSSSFPLAFSAMRVYFPVSLRIAFTMVKSV